MKNTSKNGHVRRLPDIQSRARSTSTPTSTPTPAGVDWRTGRAPGTEAPDAGSTPNGERAPIGPHPTDPDRNRLGRFVAENTGRLIHGGRSKGRAALLAPERAAERAAVLEGLALDESSVTRPLSYAIDRLVEAHFIAQSYIEFLAEQGGPITSKGRQRRAVDGWRRAADAVAKFASMVGLERRSRRIEQTTREWLLAARGSEPEAATDAEAESGALS